MDQQMSSVLLLPPTLLDSTCLTLELPPPHTQLHTLDFFQRSSYKEQFCKLAVDFPIYLKLSCSMMNYPDLFCLMIMYSEL